MPLMMSVTHSPSRATKKATPSCSLARACVIALKLMCASLGSAVIVGALATGFQYIRVVPLILEAEQFERRRRLSESEPEEWAPADGAERGAFTFLSNIIVSFCFSLLLVGLSVLDDAHVSVRSGLQRGTAGWTIFMALPCVGLSPELPGMAAADLTDRQWWWLYSVCFGSAGFLVALFACRLPAPPRPASAGSAAGLEQLSAVNLRHTLAKAALVAVAIVIAAVPHMSGAPHPHVGAIDIVETHTTCGSTHARCERSGPPSEMAASFSVWCLATAFAYWLVLGVAASAAFNATMGYQQPLPSELPQLPALERAGEAAARADKAASLDVELHAASTPAAEAV